MQHIGSATDGVGGWVLCSPHRMVYRVNYGCYGYLTW